MPVRETRFERVPVEVALKVATVEKPTLKGNGTRKKVKPGVRDSGGKSKKR